MASLLNTWVPDHLQAGFSVQNLPYGVFSAQGKTRRIGVGIGSYVLDLKTLVHVGTLAAFDFDTSTLEEPTLNRYAALGRDIHRRVRSFLQDTLKFETSLGHVLRDNEQIRGKALISMDEVKMHLPFDIGDYTDFFTSPYHAQNCTNIVRPGTQLSASLFNMPLGYHGRASSVVVSGTPVHRPRGQYVVDGTPTFGPCQKLDFELEFAAFIGKGNEQATAIPVNQAEEHIFGVVLLNDWSARDIQRAEATPLGPFNGKNFCTTISPWVVPLDALEPYRTSPAPSHAKLLPYLQQTNEASVHDIPIDVFLEVDSCEYHLTQGNTKNVLFSFAQMLAHHTAGGCPIRTGDLMGTGTLSGSAQSELGCLLEATWDGSRPLEARALKGNQKIIRNWLKDGDVVKFRVRQNGADGLPPIAFGSCEGKIVAQL